MIKRKLDLTLIAGIVLIAIFVKPAFSAIEIVAKVNGKPITNYDVEQRLNFLTAVTNIKLNDDNIIRIKTDALQMLIDEKLKLEAAQNIDPDVTSRSSAMARKLVDSSFQQKGKTGSEVLQQLGLDTTSIEQKFITDLAWASFIQSKFGNKLGNVEAKIDAELLRIENLSLIHI